MATINGPLPPAILLGGEANAVSVARSLGRDGIKVYAIGATTSPVKFSRYAEWIEVAAGGSEQEIGRAHV